MGRKTPTGRQLLLADPAHLGHVAICCLDQIAGPQRLNCLGAGHRCHDRIFAQGRRRTDRFHLIRDRKKPEPDGCLALGLMRDDPLCVPQRERQGVCNFGKVEGAGVREIGRKHRAPRWTIPSIGQHDRLPEYVERDGQGCRNRTIRLTGQQVQPVVRVDAERSLILVKGAVPGSKGGSVVIRSAVKARQPKSES